MVRPASPEPSTISTSYMDGSLHNIEPSMIWASNVDGSAVLDRTIHDIDLHRGWFALWTPNLPRNGALTWMVRSWILNLS